MYRVGLKINKWLIGLCAAIEQDESIIHIDFNGPFFWTQHAFLNSLKKACHEEVVDYALIDCNSGFRRYQGC